MTSFSIQGATNDASTSIITRGASAAQLLVNLTRGRHQNLLFAIADGNDEFAGEPRNITTRIAASIRVRKTATAAPPAPTQADDELQLGL